MDVPELVVLSRDRAERYEPAGVAVCISVTDPRTPDVQLSPGFADVLRLRFSDIAQAGGEGDVLLAAEHAREILDFVARWPRAERIVIHCVGGASRSPAIALALCDLRGWPTAPIEGRKPFWNSWVRSQLVATAAPAARAVPDAPPPAV